MQTWIKVFNDNIKDGAKSSQFTVFFRERVICGADTIYKLSEHCNIIICWICYLLNLYRNVIYLQVEQSVEDPNETTKKLKFCFKLWNIAFLWYCCLSYVQGMLWAHSIITVIKPPAFVAPIVSQGDLFNISDPAYNQVGFHLLL